MIRWFCTICTFENRIPSSIHGSNADDGGDDGGDRRGLRCVMCEHPFDPQAQAQAQKEMEEKIRAEQARQAEIQAKKEELTQQAGKWTCCHCEVRKISSHPQTILPIIIIISSIDASIRQGTNYHLCSVCETPNDTRKAVQFHSSSSHACLSILPLILSFSLSHLSLQGIRDFQMRTELPSDSSVVRSRNLRSKLSWNGRRSPRSARL